MQSEGQLTLVGAVVIGRNEGERLHASLQSVIKDTLCVYVDSGSTDNSVHMAKSLGVHVVQLDDSVSFTAARARNIGFRHLRELQSDIAYIQFVDGDCELIEGWLPTATAFLQSNPCVAVVCGRLRERFPNQSRYNLLCDMEWDGPVGEIQVCGGIAVVRAEAFEAAGGYRESLIAGEEPELCVRLRASGWRIWRLADEMAWHDAAITRFGQWWRRTVRNGHAFAEGAQLHRDSPERFGMREARSALLWGIALPIAGIALLAWSWVYGLLVLLIYPAQVARLALRGRRTMRENLLQASFWVLGKFPEALGNLRYHFSRHVGRRPQLIEYK